MIKQFQIDMRTRVLAETEVDLNEALMQGTDARSEYQKLVLALRLMERKKLAAENDHQHDVKHIEVNSANEQRNLLAG